MRKRKLLQKFLSAESKSQQDLTAVRAAARPQNQTFSLKPVCQFNRAVMLNLQTFGQNADGCNLADGQSLNRQQSLALMRLDPRGTRGRFTEVQEATDSVAEISERRVINCSP